MSSGPGETASPSVSPLTVPDKEAWRAMSVAEREREVRRIVDAANDRRATRQIGDALGVHFGTTGRVICLAEEMTVRYPGADAFIPDVLAVVDVPQLDDDPRMAWVVAHEGRGLDLVIEVLHHGNRKKDLVDNVARYAALGIPEYFVYDRKNQHVHGYRLPAPGPGRYQRIVPQLGRYPSTVLGLDLVIQGGRLRFYYGAAELLGSAEVLGRLQGMVEDLEAKADDAEARIEEERERAEQAEVRAEQALAGLREGIVAVLGARGIACSEDVRTRLAAGKEPPVLQRWLQQAMSAATAQDVFSDDDRR